MRKYILTGAPGSGKTALLRQLEMAGHPVVEEAATDVIALHQALGQAEPWHDPAFIERIVGLQRRRQLRAAMSEHGTAIFFDRSPVCTLALSRYLTVTAPPDLLAEIDRIQDERVYERAVFFVRNQGFVRRTTARRISFADALVFEQVHEETYRQLGYTLIDLPPAPLWQRAALVQSSIDPKTPAAG
jgi:predicted ATPase